MTTTTSQKQPASTASRQRLVIADDDELVRSMVAHQLRDDFECVGAAADATEAIALAMALRPDVIILDVNMPGGGAMEATNKIRDHAPETAIVILSVDETWDGLIDLLNAGAMNYLRKGMDEPAMAEDLRTAIEAHRRGRQDLFDIPEAKNGLAAA
jgi:two-component system, NarL family, nitrate/nitrite response regulator NarL